MKRNFEKITKTILLGLIIGYCVYIPYNIGYNKGFDTGLDKGFTVTLDTIHKMCVKQLNSETTVTKLVMIDKDTNVVCLSKKSLFNKK